MTDTAQFETFKTDIDEWIKTINGRVEALRELSGLMEENVGNTNHNYELIRDAIDKIDNLQQDIKTIKVTQLLIIRKVFNKDLAKAAKNQDFMEKMLAQ